MPRSKLLCLFRDLVSIFKDIYLYRNTMYIYYACTKRVHNIIFFSILLEKKKHLKFLLFNLCFPFINKNDCQKNEFNNLSYYIINKEILRDEGEIKKRRTGVDRA